MEGSAVDLNDEQNLTGNLVVDGEIDRRDRANELPLPFTQEADIRSLSQKTRFHWHHHRHRGRCHRDRARLASLDEPVPRQPTHRRCGELVLDHIR